MKTVGVRVLKDNLSAFLRMVNNGEIILVSDHNKIIAELKKPSLNYSQENLKIAKYIEEAEKTNSVEKAIKKASVLKHPSSLKDKSKIDWMKIYYADRD